jgi:four helix bundle protein
VIPGVLEMEEVLRSRNGEVREDLRERTKVFALRIVRLTASLPRSREAEVLGRQLLRSGTSVGAHWREAHRARSTAEFVSKMEGGLMELDETAYWLELIAGSGIIDDRRLLALQGETDELTRIFVASVATAKRRKPSRQHR